MSPGGVGDTGRKELGAEVWWKFPSQEISFPHPSDRVSPEGNQRTPKPGEGIVFEVTTYPSSSGTRNILLLAKSLGNHSMCFVKSQWAVN